MLTHCLLCLCKTEQEEMTEIRVAHKEGLAYHSDSIETGIPKAMTESPEASLPQSK